MLQFLDHSSFCLPNYLLLLSSILSGLSSRVSFAGLVIGGASGGGFSLIGGRCGCGFEMSFFSFAGRSLPRFAPSFQGAVVYAGILFPRHSVIQRTDHRSI